MGRGGGKKKRQPEKGDAGTPTTQSQPSTSTSDTQAATAEAPTQQVENLSIAEGKTDPNVPKVEEDEVCGLGLESSSKKRPRKKKKDASHAADQAPPVVPPQEMTGLTAAGPAQAFPKLSVGRGTGRGRGAWGPPATPQAQVFPVPSIQQQAETQAQPQVQPPPGWGARPPAVQQQAQPQQQQQQQQPQPLQLLQPQQPQQQAIPAVTPTQQKPQQAGPSGAGRGRGRVQPVGPAQQPVGPSQQPVGPALQPVGPAQQPVRPAQQPVRPAQQPVGPAQQPVGPAQQPVGPAQQPIATGQQPQGPGQQKQSGPVSRLTIPTRIASGIVTRQSRAIKVITNYLEMSIKPLKVFRYDVAFKPERPKKLLPKVFAAVKERQFPKNIIAFDQRKNCYTLTRLWNTQDERMTFNLDILDDNGAKMAFEVVVKSTGIVDLGTIINHMKTGGSSLNPPTEAIQCMGVVLQQGTLESYIRVGRQFFMRPRNPIDLFYGMEMWTGLFQSAIFTSRPFINIDVAHKAIPRQQSLLDALTKDFRLDPRKPLNAQRGFEDFKHFLKGLRVKAKIGGGQIVREYICNELVDPPNRLKFNIQDPNGKTRSTTVDKYFETEKRYRIQYPNLNCLWVGPRDKNIYYPLELLDISYGQSINKQMNEKQLQTMVREAATPPNDRLNKIKEVIQNMNYSANACFKHFQLDVADKFFQVDAKVLQAPKLDIGTGKSVEPRKGQWMANRFLKASPLNAWGLIAIESDPNACQCQSLIDMIKRVGCQMGMNARDPLMTNFNVRMSEIHRTLRTAADKGINMIFVIVPGRFKDAYEKVKRMAELEVGILTQCIREFTASRRMNDQTVKNILLKVNSKLMGINQSLETRCLPECIRNGGVMMVGADVTHPSPDQRSIPSIAAVSASIDNKCFIYNIELSLQTPKEEIIVDFENMMFDHLKSYKERQNSLPVKIFVFRDGVSEGQFAQVMDSELVAIQKAYFRLDQRVKPEILFLLVQKRHHTRFFLGENNPQNVEPGTVVDTDIVHPRELDFYLVSHQAIKGTARPTRYHVICNDGKIPSDEVEQLAFYLCHLYSRCSRSVSYPAPTYYAHLACLRARTLTSGDRFNNAELERQPKRLRVLDRMLQYSRMFYV